MSPLKHIFKLLCLSLLFTACAGESTYEVKDFGLTMTLPGGWKGGQDTYGDVLTIEFSNKGRRMLNLIKATTKVDNLEMLVKATESAGYKVLDKETTENGFGIKVDMKGKKKFIYYLNKGGEQYKFEPGPYYKEEGLEGCISIIKSTK